MKSLLVTMLLMSGAPAMAQTPLAVPDAGHVLAPPKSPPVKPRMLAPLTPPPGHAAHPQGSVRFSEIAVHGATVLSGVAIAAEFAGLRNRDVTADALKAALDRVDALYRKSGYPLARALIPAQALAEGILGVTVIEGRVGKIDVTSNDEATAALVRRMAVQLTRENPLTQATLERVILTLQDIPGVTLTAGFRALDLETGTAALELNATLKPVQIGVSLDNRAGFARLGVQPFVTATLNNLLGRGDQLALTALVSPRPSDYGYYGVSLSQLVGSEGARIGLEAAWAQALDDVSIRPFQVRSRSEQLAVTGRYPLLRAGGETLNLTARSYVTNARYNLAGPLRGVIAHDGIVAGEVGADYAKAFSLEFGVSGWVKFTQGLASFSGEPHTRKNVIPAFSKLRAEARAAWKPAENVTLKFSAQGQASPNALAASEEISFGGLNYGHGFQSAEISGDKGVGIAFQPEYRIDLGKWSVTPFLMGDYARVWNRRGDGQPSGELVSAGGGLRVGMTPVGEITLEVDKPLNRTPLDRRDKNWRFYFGMQIGADQLWPLIAGSR